MYAGYLKHMVMMESALTYLNKIGALKDVHRQNVDEMVQLTNDIQNDLVSLKKRMVQVSVC